MIMAMLIVMMMLLMICYYYCYYYALLGGPSRKHADCAGSRFVGIGVKKISSYSGVYRFGPSSHIGGYRFNIMCVLFVAAGPPLIPCKFVSQSGYEGDLPLVAHRLPCRHACQICIACRTDVDPKAVPAPLLRLQAPVA